MEEILYRIPGIYDCEEIIRTNLDEAGDDWAWDAVNVPAMWRKTGGEGVSWCTIDTDLDDQHPDVKDKLDDFADFVGRRSKFKNPHSTWCFTCTGGQEKNGYAVGLAPKSRGYAAAALNNQGSGISTAIARAINWATDKKCRVLSLSLGAPVESPEITNAINDFYAEVPDGIVIAAAGNEGEKSGHPMGWPALMPNVIAVGAMNRDGTRASFSSWDSNNLDVMGPGQDVIAGIPMNQGGLGRMSGTSMATPFVAGVACLWASLNPGKGVSAFRKALQETSKDIGKPGYDEETGWGLITPNVLQGAKPDEPNDGGFTARFYNAQVIG